MKSRYIVMLPWVILAAFWTTVILYSCGASASGLEFGIGAGLFGDVQDNRYYQEKFDHEYNRITPTIKIGYVFEPAKSWKIHAGLQYLGQMKSDAMAVSSDAIYEKYGSESVNYWPLSRYMVDNKTYGAYLTATKHFQKIYLGAGVMYQYTKQNIKVYDWHWALDKDLMIPSCDTKNLDINSTSKSFKPMIVAGYDIGNNLSIEYSISSIGLANESQEPDDYVDMNKGIYQYLMLNYEF